MLLHPGRPLRLVEPDGVLWARDLPGLELRRSPQLHRVLQELLPRLQGGHEPRGPAEEAVAALLRERGHLVEDGAAPPTGAGAWGTRPGPLRPEFPEEEELPGGLAFLAEAFHPATWLRWSGRREAQGAGLLAVGLAGDGQQGWVYAFRPGRDPCLSCFLKRWLASRGDSEGLRLVLERELALTWAPAAPPALLRQALARAVAQPGRAVLVEPGLRDAGLLPVPTCPRCPATPRNRGSLVGPLGLVKGLRRRRAGRGVHLAFATLGFPRWCTGQEGFASGAGCSGSRRRARAAALGEASERYAAAIVPGDLEWSPRNPEEPCLPRWFTPRQLSTPGFPYREAGPEDRLPWLPVLPLTPGAPASRAPAEVLLLLQRGLSPEPDPVPSYSHGLACGRTRDAALRSALLEVLERDATARFWASLLAGGAHPGRVVRRGPGGWLLEVPAAGGCRAAVALLRARGRVAAGAAARGTLGAAIRKALWEARHNRAVLLRDPGPAPPDEPTDFPEHHRYYWHFPERFPWRALYTLPPAPDSQGEGPRKGPGLDELVRTLAGEGWTAWYRELTPPDLAAWGRHVVRVLVPGLLALPGRHDAWPRGLPRWRDRVGDPDATAPRRPHPFG